MPLQFRLFVLPNHKTNPVDISIENFRMVPGICLKTQEPARIRPQLPFCNFLSNLHPFPKCLQAPGHYAVALLLCNYYWLGLTRERHHASVFIVLHYWVIDGHQIAFG